MGRGGVINWPEIGEHPSRGQAASEPCGPAIRAILSPRPGAQSVRPSGASWSAKESRCDTTRASSPLPLPPPRRRHRSGLRAADTPQATCGSSGDDTPYEATPLGAAAPWTLPHSLDNGRLLPPALGPPPPSTRREPAPRLLQAPAPAPRRASPQLGPAAALCSRGRSHPARTVAEPLPPPHLDSRPMAAPGPGARSSSGGLWDSARSGNPYAAAAITSP